MALLNAGMLAGLVLVAIPIVLHLSFKPRPKHIVFPALQWVKPRLRTNQRHLHWKQWLLLFLRSLVIALLALALARPTVASSQLGRWITCSALGALGVLLALLATWVLILGRSRLLTGIIGTAAGLLLVASLVQAILAWRSTPPILLGQQAPVAAVLVFDTSPRMAYRADNRSRIEQAAQFATQILRHLPAESVAAAIDSQSSAAVFSLDPAAVATAVKNLRPSFVPRPWTDLVRDALQLLAQADHERKEIYLFTDLNHRVWTEQTLQQLRREADAHPDVNWYLIDVGVDAPKNVSMGLLRLSAERTSREGDLVIQTVIQSLGIESERVVELLIEPPDPQYPYVRDGVLVRPNAVLRGSRTITLQSEKSHALEFRIQGLPEGTVHGRVRITGQDGLTWDDVRYFTVYVQQAWPVLLAAPQDVSLRFLAEALAPFELREQGRARFDCTQMRIEELARQELSRFAAVVLADPPPLEPDVWKSLVEYVHGGGGLAVFLGHHAAEANFNLSETIELLGGSVSRIFRSSGRDLFLVPHDGQHPIWRVFRESASSVPWHAFPVFRHWNFDTQSESVRFLAYYSNGEPALLEHAVGKGKVLVMTTPLSDTARPPGRLPWNEFVFGEDPWPQFVLINEMMLYLVASGVDRFNYYSGEVATFALRPQVDPDRFQVFPPTGEPYQLSATSDRLSVRFTETPGHYDLKGKRGDMVHRGFSVNIPEELTDLKRIDPETLNIHFGRGRLQRLRDVRQIERAQGQQRLGREFYSLLMLLLVVLVAVEYAFANRFYRRQDI